jgi:hypothetical protein
MRDASRNSAIGLENEWTQEYWSLVNLKNRKAGMIRIDSMEEVHLEATTEQAGATRCISGRPTDQPSIRLSSTSTRQEIFISYHFDTVHSLAYFSGI